ncbi:MAG: hypothetical protein P1U46_04595 [Patescibacteria group bacterium]|nr:hypothetical protein [Patescibacteria group bacterium]
MWFERFKFCIYKSIVSLSTASISIRAGIHSYSSISNSVPFKKYDVLYFFFSLVCFIPYFSKTILKLSTSVISFSHSSAIFTHFSHHSLFLFLFLFIV